MDLRIEYADHHYICSKYNYLIILRISYKNERDFGLASEI